MSKDLEKLTRNDLEQILGDHTDRVVGSVEHLREEMITRMDSRFDKVDGDIAEVRVTVDRIDNKHSEDIQTIYHENELIKKHVGMKENT